MNRLATTLALIIFSSAALAEHPPALPLTVEIGSTMVGAATSADEHESAGIAAFDVAASLPIRSGQFSLLIEAETRPGFKTGATGYHSTHHYSGVASDDSQNVVEVAEFHYDFVTAGGEWSVGFIDSKAYIDGSSVANDDKTQFSNPAFVNNPTIGLPDNSLGLSWRRPLDAGQRGYSLLFATQNGPGSFMAIETWWAFAAVTARLGAWDNSLDRSTVDDSSATHDEYGFYTSIDGNLGLLNWNVRAGIANPARKYSDSFISIAAEIPVVRNTIGIAVGRGMQGDTRSVAGSRKISHIEMYYRHVVAAGIVITPCIQFSHQGAFGHGVGTLMAGVRFRLNI